ncbi:MAG: hypothetical protein IJ091_10380 [Oscillospiraceae bacterium]|nr:hypothetical protein [Oscillospiraceae bacterium]
MTWYEPTAQALEVGRTFTRSDLKALLARAHPELNSNSFQWAIGGMLKSGMLVRVGYDAYLRADGKPLCVYSPDYSERASELICNVADRFPHVQFTVFETALLNEFLNHLIAQNTIFLQVEKDAAIFVFRYLQEGGRRDVLFKPSRKEFSLYWEKDSVIVTNLISEAPVPKDTPHQICLKKMLVDLYCDKQISTTYSKAEYRSLIAQATAQYTVDRTRLLRYARRRNKEAEIVSYLKAAEKRE